METTVMFYDAGLQSWKVETIEAAQLQKGDDEEESASDAPNEPGGQGA